MFSLPRPPSPPPLSIPLPSPGIGTASSSASTIPSLTFPPSFRRPRPPSFYRPSSALDRELDNDNDHDPPIPAPGSASPSETIRRPPGVSANAPASARLPAAHHSLAALSVTGAGASSASDRSQHHTYHHPRTSSLLPPPNLIVSNQDQPQPQHQHQQHQHSRAASASAHPAALQQQHHNLHHHLQLDDDDYHNHLQPHQSARHPHDHLFRDPFDASSQPSYVAAAPNSLPPPQSRFPPRSSSAAGISDGLRTLNRWSVSTTSSRASIGIPRRQSIDSVALSAQINAQYHSLATAASAAQVQSTPPRKLQKHRPSISPSASRARRQSPSPAPVPPLEALPPIVALPSLEQEVSTPLPDNPRRASPAQDQYQRRNDSVSLDATNSRRSTLLLEERTRTSSPYGRRPSDATMMYADRNGSAVPQQPQQKGHSRNRSQAKGSNDTTASRGSRDRSSKQPSQKAMLSRALEKANSAVQLDNTRNFEGARQAYAEACDLLHQVLVRTGGEEDRKKLEAISKTYTTRIEELDEILPQNKPAPPRPIRPPRDDVSLFANGDERERERSQSISSYSQPIPTQRMEMSGARTPSATSRFGSVSGPSTQSPLQSSFSQQQLQRKASNTSELGLARSVDSHYMPPPLSPRRPLSPARPTGRASPDAPYRADFSMPSQRLAPPSDHGYQRGHSRNNSHESASWLDPIDESGGSNASSNHSRSSSLGVRRKHLRNPSGDTEAEFDAALDDAIEAAYDDGYDVNDNDYPENGEDVVSRALKRVEEAKERVRQSEREAMELANDREKRLREQLRLEDEAEGGDDFFDPNDSEEEERMLEEMTKGFTIDDFAFGAGIKTRPPVPRASDSSELTSRTWHTSMGSNPPTATTVLSTVSEATVMSKGPKAPLPPPTQALPQLPPQRPSTAGPQSAKNGDSVRDRRLSNPKKLKIETSRKASSASSRSGPPTAGTMYIPETPPIPQAQPPLPKTAGFIAQQRQGLTAGAGASRKQASPLLNDIVPPTPPLPPGIPHEFEPRAASPVAMKQPALRKNYSSSSLRSLKTRNISTVSNIDDASDMSPGTPLSNHFANRLPAVPNLPTPIAAAFKDRMNAGSTTGMYLLDSDFHSMTSMPGSPTSTIQSDAPVPLEPCPTGTMLRPFWLMRCLYQTLAHPRGGYLSNKLFVPRDVWKVKGVKLKNIDDKISNCDLLTAALQKLSRIDTCDADALLEEMQSLESVFEQVQATLSRRLGGEVGVQSMSQLFRDAAAGGINGGGAEPDSAGSVPRSASVSGKSSFSWRRLRSKNSNAGLGNGYASNVTARKDSPASAMMDSANKDLAGGAPAVVSLPMTAHPTSRPTKRDIASVQFSGPNANYMSALARLFDAAQAVDQIARQVEDPGLRHADKTQVGLELCTRHAAEFFAFYICRFVLTDLTILLDKFVKRGSEWVLV